MKIAKKKVNISNHKLKRKLEKMIVKTNNMKVVLNLKKDKNNKENCNNLPKKCKIKLNKA